MDKVHFLPSIIEIPTTNSVDQISESAKYLTTVLKEHQKPTTPHLEFGYAKLNDLNNYQEYLMGPPQSVKKKHNGRKSPTSEGASTAQRKAHKGAHPVISEGAND